MVTSAAKTVIVDRTAPSITAFMPANNAKNVYFKDEISVTFNEAVQPSSLTATSVILEQSPIPVRIVIPTALTLDAMGKKLIIKPTSRPNLGGPIFFKVESVKDLAGNAMELTSSVFEVPEWQAPGGTAALDLNPALTADTAPQSLAVDSSGNQVIAWSESDGTSSNVYVKRWNGSSWTQVGTTFLDFETNKDAIGPALKLDSSGNPVVAWSEGNGNANTIYVKRWNGSAWVQVGSSAVSTNFNAKTPALALDSSGNPVVVWRESFTAPTFSNIQIRRWDGSAWVNVGSGKLDVNDSGDVDRASFAPSVALTSSGNPVVAWSESDGTSRNIYVKRWNGSAWTQIGSQLDVNSNQEAYTPSIALDSSGNPVVAWNEADTNSSGSIYVKRWNGAVWAQLGSKTVGVLAHRCQKFL